MRGEVEPPSSTDISRFQLWIRPSSPEPVAAPLFLSFADSQSASPTSVGKGSCSHRPLAPTVISPCRQLMASSVNLATSRLRSPRRNNSLRIAKSRRPAAVPRPQALSNRSSMCGKAGLGQFVELLLVGDKSFADSLADQRTDNAKAVDNQSSPSGSAFELPVDAQLGQLLTLAPDQHEAGYQAAWRVYSGSMPPQAIATQHNSVLWAFDRSGAPWNARAQALERPTLLVALDALPQHVLQMPTAKYPTARKRPGNRDSGIRPSARPPSPTPWSPCAGCYGGSAFSTATIYGRRSRNSPTRSSMPWPTPRRELARSQITLPGSRSVRCESSLGDWRRNRRVGLSQ